MKQVFRPVANKPREKGIGKVLIWASRQDTPLVNSKATRKSSSNGKNKSRWPFNKRESFVFTSGALFAAGLISLGFYMGVTRPSALAQEPTTYVISQSTEESVETATAEPVEPDAIPEEAVTVEVDAGIDVADIDWTPPPPPDPDSPSRFIIDSLGQNSPVRSLGLSSTGALAVPNYTSQVGWYNKSPKPGNPGTIVMDGHYGIPAGTAAFGRLSELALGDVVSIKNHAGETFTYAIERLESYDLGNVPMDQVIASDGQERLNLITCNGGWSKDAGTYESRLIVYTKRV